MRAAVWVPLLWTALLGPAPGPGPAPSAAAAATPSDIDPGSDFRNFENLQGSGNASPFITKDISNEELEEEDDGNIDSEPVNDDDAEEYDYRTIDDADIEIRSSEERRTDAKGCAVDLAEDVAVQEPLILQKRCGTSTSLCKWEIPEGDEDLLRFQPGEEILVACPDKNNKLISFSSQPKTIVAVCTAKQNPTFEVDGKEYSVQDFACEKISKGEILSKNTNCGPRNAELLEIGFPVRDQWHPLIKVCHVKSRGETLFTEHTLQGESTKSRRTAKRPSFEEGGLYQEISANDAYKNANKTLRDIIGSSKYPSSVSSSIDRGHLSPDGDFPITPYRYTTYFYVNAVPMWSVINRGNWVVLEEKIRGVAKKSRVDFQITTGVFRVFEATDKNGNKKELFLSTNTNRKQIPVPKFLWKVVYNAVSKEGIAFVLFNDPFVKSFDPSDELCSNICKNSGWHDSKWKRFSKGYLYCCDVHELKKFISYLPKYNIKSILTGPN